METRQHNIDTRWALCLRLIKNNLPERQFKTWFEPIHAALFNEEEQLLTLSVPSPFVYEYIEEHFVNLLRKVLQHVYGKDVRLMYQVTTDATNGLSMELEVPQHAPTTLAQPVRTTGLNQSPQPLQQLDAHLRPELSFENFIEGDANKLPLAVGKAIAQNPRQSTFNPLFIYGGSGVGKTHLVNAIGLQLQKLHPQKRVLYVSAHLFQVQYADAVRQNKTNDFISFYQSIDVLIIDDVQEFATLQKTQLAFFHIFNHLHQNGRQLILTSDRPPVALQGMEERLLTRFKWGLLAELERPGIQLRHDILRYKMRCNGLQFPDPVVDFIAQHVDKSIRDLEGVVNSLMVYSVVHNCDIDVPIAERVITRTIGLSAQSRTLTVEDILEQTCSFFQLDRDDVLSQSRKASVVLGRQVAMYLAQKHTTLSTTKIGIAIGRRNHTTVVHSCQSINQRIDSDADFRNRIAELEQLLKA